MKLGAKLWTPPSAEAAQEFYQFSKEHPLDAILKLYNSEEAPVSLNSNNRAKEIGKLIIAAIEHGNPFSLTRMSDGEGNCLFNDENYPNLQKYVKERISYIHFGDNFVVPSHSDHFFEMMQSSISTADVVCVPEHQAISRGFQADEESLDVRAAVGNRMSAIGVSRLINQHQITASAWTNRHLLEYYKTIFGGRECVGVIASYPGLAEMMKKQFQIGEVIQHVIPQQAVFLKTSDRKNSFHFPDVFEKIVGEINPITPGMPYLVSGGLLAKYYCHVIKSRGGVAIDTGSVPEIWLGIPNRGLSEEFISRWKLNN